MKTIDMIRLLGRIQKGVFGINDIMKIIRKPKGYGLLVLYRLKKKDLITEIEKNKYALKDINPYVIFSNLVYPSYLSFLTAFSYYNLTTQIPKQVQIISLKSKKGIKFENYLLKFIKFRPYRFFGYRREKGTYGFIFIAEKEKAIIDSLFLPKYSPIDEVYNALIECKNIDIEKLVNYALRMKSIVLLKRLGYLLEKRNIDIYKRIKNKINKKYDFLSGEKKNGEKNKKWKIIINKRLE